MDTPQTSKSSSNSKTFFKRPLFLVTILGLLALASVGLFLINNVSSNSQNNTTKANLSGIMPSNAAIEERWGIRISQIGVSADGGLIDFRFVVLDSEKALNMIKDEKNLPVLVSEDSNGLVNSAALMPAKHAMNPGQTYFLLYRNTNGAVKHNTNVSVVMGDLKLEHATVK